MSLIVNNILILIILLFQAQIVVNEANEYKYFFQLYCSVDQEKPYYFYAQTNQNLIVINSTDGENMTITEKRVIDEYAYKDISSVSLIDDKFLVKTCFGPDKLVEVEYNNKETFAHKNNNFGKIKFCYTTKINNPYINSKNPDEYIIMTYWTEIDDVMNEGKYIHKCILFYPQSNTFSDELNLSSGDKFVIDKFHPERCITFRNANIFCGIHFSPEDSDATRILGNHYIIETNKLLLDAIYHTNSSIYLVYSNSKLTANSFQAPISLNKIENIPSNGKGDIYMTEFHNYEENGNGKTLLLYSYYIKNSGIRRSFISYYEGSNSFYGINIQDNYINQNLFNYLVPNEDELIILYIFKEMKMSLFLTRFNTSDSNTNKLHIGFKDISPYTYKRTDICEEPKYFQSIYINSFINYDITDKNIIHGNSNKNYYKYQKDIGILISCSENYTTTHQPIKIELPQCLNTLDEINGNNKHNIKFNNKHTEEIFDLYGDPNLLSLRNVEINFNPSIVFTFLFMIQVKVSGETNFKNISYNVDYKNVTHIKFKRRYNYITKTPITLQYRVKQNSIIKNNYSSRLLSDICELTFENNNNEIESPENGETQEKKETNEKSESELNNESEENNESDESNQNNEGYDGINEICYIDYCIICRNNIMCQICDNVKNTELINDEVENSETYGKCICNESIGFKKIPKSEFNMCICKDNYSFYRTTRECKSNEDLEKMPTYIIDKDDTSGINIYEDCFITCSKCSKGGFSYDEQNCDECKEGYILEGTNCYEDQVKMVEDNVCLSDKKIWFKLGEYIFYYAKIDKCIFIYEEDNLFFISNKKDCLNILNNQNNTYRYLSVCLHNYLLYNKYNYIDFINDAKEYIPNANNITIDKLSKNEEFYFHLYNSEMKYNNISSIYLEGNETIDLLLFKVDIKRNDTISTQVEYQLYNPIPEYIYQTIDFIEYLSKKYKLLQNISTENYTSNYFEYIYLDLPIYWSKNELEKIKELYKFNINPFDSKSDFYLDVCYKYTTPNNDDIYLQERKEEYYLDKPFCEDNCTFIKYNFDTNKVTCKCKPKTSTDNYDKISFKFNDKDEEFKKKYIAPNIKAIKCKKIVMKTLNRNLGFFITLFLLIIFFIIFLINIIIISAKNCKLCQNSIKSIPKIKEPIDSNTDEKILINADVLNLSNSSSNGKTSKTIVSSSNELKEKEITFIIDSIQLSLKKSDITNSVKTVNILDNNTLAENQNSFNDNNNDIINIINNKVPQQQNYSFDDKEINPSKSSKRNIKNGNHKNKKVNFNDNNYTEINKDISKSILISIDDDFLYDTMNYDKIKSKGQNYREERHICTIFLSLLRNNSTILFVFTSNHNDNFLIRISFLIIWLSLYICFNILLAFNMSIINLYIDFKFDNFLINIFIIPCFVNLISISFKKLLSQKTLLYDYLKEVINKKSKSPNFDVNKCIMCKYIIYGIIGLLFLIFNLILVTSFCGIYPNSSNKLGINVIFSILGSSIFTLLFYAIGALSRKLFCLDKYKACFYCVKMFNPLNISCPCFNKEKKNDVQLKGSEVDSEEQFKKKKSEENQEEKIIGFAS